MMREIFLALQILVSVSLVVAIVLQAQGTGLGSTWGGGGESYHTRRGVEKVLFALTIVGIILFAVLSIINILLLKA